MSRRKGIKAWLRLDSDEARREWDNRIALLVGVVAAAIIVATSLGAAVMLWHIYRGGEVPSGRNPLTSIFASRLMLAAARLAILFAGVYIVLSVLMHMRRGQWLTAAGPFKVSESVTRLTSTLASREALLRQSLHEQERLKSTVSGLTNEVRTLERLLAKAQQQLREDKA